MSQTACRFHGRQIKLLHLSSIWSLVIDAIGVNPSSVTHLAFAVHFNQPITKLTFSDRFNQPIVIESNPLLVIHLIWLLIQSTSDI
jgi:hypothetical protein